MSTSDHTINPINAATTLTLAGLRDTILADENVEQRRRQGITSSFRRLEKVLGLPLATFPATPIELRKRLKGVVPAMTGVSAGRWRNVLSDLQFALGWAGLSKIPGRYKERLTPTWAALIEPVTSPGDRYKLGRLGRYCGMHGIAPTAVTDTVMDNFLHDLKECSLSHEPERRHREAAISWNRCADQHPAWPQQRLTVPDNRNSYAVPWSDLPPTLKADVDALLYHLSGQDPFGELEGEGLRDTSLAKHLKQLHLWVSALVLQGVPPAELKTLADVVTRERVAKGFQFFWDRAGGKASVHGAHIAGMVRAIARHWVKLEQPDLDWLKAKARKITPKTSGMTAKNRERLRALDDSATELRLLTLPDRMCAEVVRRGAPTVALALQMQTAVALAILRSIPVRMFNLVRLSLGTQLISNLDGRMSLVLAAEDVKNSLPYEGVVPPRAVRWIKLYIRDYRPLLGGDGNAWLFPGKVAGKPKSDDRLRQQIQDCIRSRCGLAFNPHLFRHALARIVLRHNPGAHGVVQRALGHKSLATTMKYYAGLEAGPALQLYDTLLLEQVSEADVPLVARVRRKVRA